MANFSIKPAAKPGEVRRTFASNSSLRRWYFPAPLQAQTTKTRPRQHMVRTWPTKRLDYDFLNRCKNLVCRVPHPTHFLRAQGLEWQVNTLPWSRGSYLDIREYRRGSSTQRGLLLHLDVIKAMLPEIIRAVQQMESEDAREPEQCATVEVLMA